MSRSASTFGRLIPALLMLAACGGEGPGALLPQIAAGSPRTAVPEASAVWRDDVRLRLAGVLAEPEPARDTAPQCPVLVLDDGRVYALIGDLRRFGPGDQIEVTGPPAVWSTCQTYRVLRADTVALIRRWAPG
ncbi:MAG: DUF5818 domain-containing protein [Alphaproteobacteria bacterium]